MISAFRSSTEGWVVWIETPAQVHIFGHAPSFAAAQDLAESVIEERLQKGTPNGEPSYPVQA